MVLIVKNAKSKKLNVYAINLNKFKNTFESNFILTIDGFLKINIKKRN